MDPAGCILDDPVWQTLGTLKLQMAGALSALSPVDRALVRLIPVRWRHLMGRTFCLAPWPAGAWSALSGMLNLMSVHLLWSGVNLSTPKLGGDGRSGVTQFDLHYVGWPWPNPEFSRPDLSNCRLFTLFQVSALQLSPAPVFTGGCTSRWVACLAGEPSWQHTTFNMAACHVRQGAVRQELPLWLD